jgi:hypothetical protein
MCVYLNNNLVYTGGAWSVAATERELQSLESVFFDIPADSDINRAAAAITQLKHKLAALKVTHH